MKVPAKIHVLLLPVTLSFQAVGFVENKQLEAKSKLPIKIEQKVLRPEVYQSTRLFESAQSSFQTFRDTQTQETRILYGNFDEYEVKTKSLRAKDFLRVIHQFIDDQGSSLGFSKDDLSPVQDATLINESEQFFKFKVRRAGLIVADSNIDFRFKYGQLSQVINQSYSEAIYEPTSTNFDMSGVFDPSFKIIPEQKADFFRVAFDKDLQGYRLRKVRSVSLSNKAGAYLKAQVDVDSGEVFEVKDTKLFASLSVSGPVHERWYHEPLVVAPFPFLSLTAGQSRVTTDEAGQSIGIDTLSAPAFSHLNGPFVSIENLSGTTVAGTAMADNGNWILKLPKGDMAPHLDKITSQSMVFLAITKLNQQLKRYINAPWLNRPLVAYTNLNRTCNAHWDGRTINLYSGDSQCANTGLITDVIYHEFGHGLDANTGGIEDGAFSEGFGDILAMTMTHSNLLGIGFFVDGAGPVRDLAADKIYPRDAGEVHDEGMIIGSTFWDLYVALKDRFGEETAGHMLSNYSYKMIFTARTYLDVYHALLVIDDNDANLSNGTPNLCLLNEVFSQHGLAQKDNACSLASIRDVQITDADQDQIIEPGESVSLRFLAYNATRSPLEMLVGKVSTRDEAILSVEQPKLAWDVLEGGKSQYSTNEAILKINQDAACGAKFTTQLTLTAQNKSITTNHTLQVGKNIGQPLLYTVQDLPTSIPDMDTLRIPIDVQGGDWTNNETISEASLAFHITHSYRGDIRVRLTSPSGQSVDIYRGQGREHDVDYNADITALIERQPGAGTWYLEVSDVMRRDYGSLDNVSLTLRPNKFICN